MTDRRVRPCRNYLLVLGDRNGRCRKCIHLEHKEDNEKTERHQNVACDRYWQRDRRPGKAMIERRNDHGAHECEGRQQLYDLLTAPSFGSRTRVESALEELPIFLPQVCGN